MTEYARLLRALVAVEPLREWYGVLRCIYCHRAYAPEANATGSVTREVDRATGRILPPGHAPDCPWLQAKLAVEPRAAR